MTEGETKIVNAALALVAAWDGDRDDHRARAALVDCVHALCRPAPTQTVSGARAPLRGGNYIDTKKAEMIVDYLKLGLSQRFVGRALTVKRTTVARYFRLNGPFTCPCGRPGNHRGQCDTRRTGAPLRFAFLRRWLESKPKDGRELITAVNAVIPRALPDHMRADVAQNLMLAVLEGKCTVEALRGEAVKAIRAYYKLHPLNFGPVSIDAPIRGTDGLTLADVLADDAVHI